MKPLNSSDNPLVSGGSESPDVEPVDAVNPIYPVPEPYPRNPITPVINEPFIRLDP